MRWFMMIILILCAVIMLFILHQIRIWWLIKRDNQEARRLEKLRKEQGIFGASDDDSEL